MPVDFSVTNQLASPAIYASSFATRPAASFKGRLFVDTDNPSSGIYRDTGTAWIAIAGTSVGEIQSLNDVCVVGNSTTTLGINIFGQTALGQTGGIQIAPQPNTALTIGDFSESAESLYVEYNAIFNTTAKVNTSLTTPLLIGGTTDTSTLTYRTTSNAGITGARHIFQVGNNGATEAMTILNNANVGIGIVAPNTGFVLNIGSGFFKTSHDTITGPTSYTNMPGFGAGLVVSYDNINQIGRIASVSQGNNYTNLTVQANDIIFCTGFGSTTERARITNLGVLVIGTTSPAASSLLDVTSTTKGFLPPRMTTTQKNAIAAPAAGLMVYDTTLNKLAVFTTVWETITSI